MSRHNLDRLGWYESIGKFQTTLTANILIGYHDTIPGLTELNAASTSSFVQTETPRSGNYGTQCTPDLSLISVTGKEPRRSMGLYLFVRNVWI
jgi:hypothetical protein